MRACGYRMAGSSQTAHASTLGYRMAPASQTAHLLYAPFGAGICTFASARIRVSSSSRACNPFIPLSTIVSPAAIRTLALARRIALQPILNPFNHVILYDSGRTMDTPESKGSIHAFIRSASDLLFFFCGALPPCRLFTKQHTRAWFLTSSSVVRVCARVCVRVCICC